MAPTVSDPLMGATEAVRAGDEHRWGFIKQGVQTKLQEFLPHHGHR